jgi:hypothetical protein
MKIRGEVEVVIEDEAGRVIHRTRKNNTITEAAGRVLLWFMFYYGGGASTLLRKKDLSVATPSTCGIYTFDSEKPVAPDTMIPPFVNPSRGALAWDVKFYNVGNATSENAQIMVRRDDGCYFNVEDNIMTVEFRKNSGSGDVKSIVVGRDFASKSQVWNAAMQDPRMAVDFFAAYAQHLLEHTANGTIVHGSSGATGYQCFGNLKTKEFVKTAGVAAYHGAITGYYGGLVLQNTVCKCAQLSASVGAGGKVRVQLTYVKNFKSSTDVSTLGIDFSGRVGSSILDAYHPVMVLRPDNGTLEVFQTTAIISESGSYGANVHKAIVEINANGNLSLMDIEDMGVVPYTVSNYPASSANGYYMTGTYHDGKYTLPVHSHISSDGTETITAANDYQEGIEIGEDFGTIHRNILFRVAAGQSFAYVVTEEDKVLPIEIALASLRYLYMSQVFSGLVLDEALTKRTSDVLSLVYRYIFE